jgi:calcyclin binding protein
MVEVTEVTTESTPSSSPSLSPSEERTLDANEIESICNQYATRPTVKAHLTSLVQKIKRDALALKKMEDSRMKLEKEHDEGNTKDEEVLVEEVPISVTKATAMPTVPQATVTPSASPSPSLTKYKAIDKFSFDAGSYSSPTISIYITSLPNLSKIPSSNITCQFTPTSFDLQILNYTDGQNYRLYKDNLSNDIDVTKSKYIVKSNKIIIKLGKIKNDYGGYDTWNELSSKKGKESKNKMKNDPSGSIMDLMKEMYDSGDDNMKKMIGETMLKQRQGKLNDGPGGMSDMGMDDL